MYCRDHHEPPEGAGILHERQARGVCAAAGHRFAPNQELPPARAPARLQPDERGRLAVAVKDSGRPSAAGPAGFPEAGRRPHPGRPRQSR